MNYELNRTPLIPVSMITNVCFAHTSFGEFFGLHNSLNICIFILG